MNIREAAQLFPDAWRAIQARIGAFVDQTDADLVLTDADLRIDVHGQRFLRITAMTDVVPSGAEHDASRVVFEERVRRECVH